MKDEREAFAWYDDHYIANLIKNGTIEPLALVRRAVALIDDLEASVLEVSEDANRWLLIGLSEVLAGPRGAGELLAGLEGLIPASRRATWALHEECHPNRKPVPLKRVAGAQGK